MFATLRPCPACHRHVRYTEADCPFCTAALPKEAPPRLADVSRMSRAARVALGAAVVAACAGDPKPEPATPVPVYGAPAPVEPVPGDPPPEGEQGGPIQPAPTPAADGGVAGPPPAIAPMYGVPPPPGTPPAPPPQKGGPNDQGNVRPLYGVPPPKQ